MNSITQLKELVKQLEHDVYTMAQVISAVQTRRELRASGALLNAQAKIAEALASVTQAIDILEDSSLR